MSNGDWNATIGFAVSLISEVAIFNAFNNKVRVFTFYDHVFVSIILNVVNTTNWQKYDIPYRHI